MDLNKRRMTKPGMMADALAYNTAASRFPLSIAPSTASPAVVSMENPWRPSISVGNVAKVSAFVGNLVENLVHHIEVYGRNSILVGCFAWLSNPIIIDAIAKNCSGALILVNDENFASWGNGKNIDLYKRLPHIKKPLNELFGHLDTPLKMWNKQNYDPVRCIKNTGDALMHSKYFVFFTPVAVEKRNPYSGEMELVWQDVPTSVWTGSMNGTIKSSRNQENAVFIESEHIARFYFNDFASSFIPSEPLRITGKASSFGGGGTNVNNDTPVQQSPLLSAVARLPIRDPMTQVSSASNPPLKHRTTKRGKGSFAAATKKYTYHKK